MLDVLWVHKADFSDLIVLNDDARLVLDYSTYLLTDLVNSRKCEAFAFDHVFLGEFGLVNAIFLLLSL